MSDEEWEFFTPLLIETGRKGGGLAITGRFWTGIFWIIRIGSPWRDLPAEFGGLELRHWTEAELWDVMLALPESDISDTRRKSWTATSSRRISMPPGGKGGFRNANGRSRLGLTLNTERMHKACHRLLSEPG